MLTLTQYFHIVRIFWYAGAGLKAYASARLWSNGQIARVPALWALVTALFLDNITTIWFQYQNQGGPILAVYPYLAFVIWVCEGASIIAAFRSLTESFPRFGYSVTVLLGALAVLGACACWMGGFFKAPAGWQPAWEIALVIQRNVGLVMVATLAGSRLAIAMMGFPTRRSARRLADILTLYVSGAFVASAFAVHSQKDHPVIVGMLPICNGAVFATLLSFGLVRAADRAEDLIPVFWAPAVEQPKAALLQMEGREEIGHLLGAKVKPRDEERGRGASSASA